MHIRAQTVTPMLLVVGEEMFSTCLYSDALHAHNGFVGTFSIKIGIWTKASLDYLHYPGKRIGSGSPFPPPTSFRVTHLFFFQIHYSRMPFVEDDKRTMSNAGPKNTL